VCSLNYVEFSDAYGRSETSTEGDLVRHAVQREPFWREFSLLTGKRTGKMQKSGPYSQIDAENGMLLQLDRHVFPAINNRERFWPEQGTRAQCKRPVVTHLFGFASA
jgi:hypothetical protein